MVIPYWPPTPRGVGDRAELVVTKEVGNRCMVDAPPNMEQGRPAGPRFARM